MGLDDLADLLDDEAKAVVTYAPSERCKKVIGLILSADTKENFAGSHDPDGNAWVPLKRPRKGSKGKDKPLVDWGVLMANAATAAGEAEVTGIANGIRIEIDAGSILGHDGTVRGDWHRLGTKTIPAREFLGVSAEAEEQIAEAVLEDHARQTGGL